MSNSLQKSTPVFSNLIDAWKVRPINGFEKHLFPNTQILFNSTAGSFIQRHNRSARFIYPRDAMGNTLTTLLNRNTPTSFYLPKYEFIKTRSPIWTIKNVHQSKEVIHHVGPMAYDSANDKSQLPCKSGWTQLGRRPFSTNLGLTVPFYDTRKYKQVGDPCSKHAVIIGRQIARKETKSKRHPSVTKKKSDDIEYIYHIRDHEAFGQRRGSIDEILFSSKNLHRKSNNLTTADDYVVEVPSEMIITDQKTTASRADKTEAKDNNTPQLKILPSEEFQTFESIDGVRS